MLCCLMQCPVQASVEHRLQLLAEQAQHLLQALHQAGLRMASLGQGCLPPWTLAWQRRLASHASIDDSELLLCLRHAEQVGHPLAQARITQQTAAAVLLLRRQAPCFLELGSLSQHRTPCCRSLTGLR